MNKSKADIFARLQKEILPLQGFKSALTRTAIDIGPGPIKHAFPGAAFPLGAVHEFICNGPESATATSGFIAGILSALMKHSGASVWVSSSRKIYPSALKFFGIEPDKIIFIDLQKEKDVLWAMEEALKCEGLAAVVAEMQELSFTASRRLQLAIEQSQVTGFILRQYSRNLNTTACVTRWKVSSISSVLPDDMPGVGFPRWQVELLKVRNGKPGKWEIEWVNEGFRSIYQAVPIIQTQQRKTG